ncbi:MAG: hypothetical protein LH654_15750 [Thermoleophilia bacterium]|nr:hypothetical protein [Thermoleophilia bacterium]
MDRFSFRRFFIAQLAGVAIFLYLAGAVVELITRGVVGDYLGQGRRKRAIGHLRDHTIICGFGRAGSAHQIERLEAMFAPRDAPDG